MTEKLYHKDLGFPPKIQKLLDVATDPSNDYVMRLKYTRHAASQQYRHVKKINGVVQLPDRVLYKDCEPVEVRTKDGKIIKVLYRTPYDKNTDLILVVAHDLRVNLVVTLWLNDKDDHHDTLDKSRYTIPEASYATV